MTTAQIKTASQSVGFISLIAMIWLAHDRLNYLEPIIRTQQKEIADLQLRTMVTDYMVAIVTNSLEVTPTNWLSQSNFTSQGMLTNGWLSITNLLVNTNPPGWVYGMARNGLPNNGTNSIWKKVLISTNGGKDIIYKGEYKTFEQLEQEGKERHKKIMRDIDGAIQRELEKFLHPVPEKPSHVI